MFSKRTFLTTIAALSLVGGHALAQDKKPYVALISKGFQHQFWQAVKAGADKAAAEFGAEVTLEGPNNETQVDKQIDMLAAAIAKKPTAIAFAPLDVEAALPLLQQTQKDNIPVIAFDDSAGDIPRATAATDSVASAALAADKMAGLIGNSGKVAVVAHSQTVRTGVNRRDGFVNRIKDAYKDIEIVAIEYGDGDHLKSTEITKALLTANPDIKGIFGTNEGSAIGVINGVKEAGAKVVVIGYDSGKAQKDAIRDGTMAGAITQNPIGIGYETVKAALAASKGEKVEKTIDTGFFWYDKTNIDDPEIAAVLYD